MFLIILCETGMQQLQAVYRQVMTAADR